jgi:hypothetical protein
MNSFSRHWLIAAIGSFVAVPGAALGLSGEPRTPELSLQLRY